MNLIGILSKFAVTSRVSWRVPRNSCAPYTHPYNVAMGTVQAEQKILQLGIPYGSL